MILGPVAPFSQSMSPWRATATHFVAKTMTFRFPHNANICYHTPKILILGPRMYCKQRNLCCRHKYMPQRHNLYAANKNFICCKYTKYMLQISNVYFIDEHITCCKYTFSIGLIQTFMCITYTEFVLSKFGASGCAPAGAFSPPKIHLLYFISRYYVFLCLRCVKHVLSKLGATKCAPAGAFPPPRKNLLYLKKQRICLFVSSIHKTFGATKCAPAGASSHPKYTVYIYRQRSYALCLKYMKAMTCTF